MVLTTHLKKNIICNVIKGKSQWEKLLLMFFFFLLFLLKFNAGKTQYFNFLLILPTSHNIHVVLFLVKMMAIVFYCTPTLDVFWILGLLTLRLQKVKIVKSMIIKNLQRLYNQYISWKYFEWDNLQSCSSNILQQL